MSQTAPAKRPEFSCSMPPRVEELPAVRADLRAWLSDLDVPEPAAEDIVLAAWEVCANAIEHPVTPDQDVAVEAKALPRGIRIVVCDAGTWKSRRLLRPNRGLGLRLIEGLVDRMSIKRGLGQTEVVLFRCTRHA
jgi:anti-sigma regulatory factor (Ser/Thr protein kinase)